MGDEGMMKKKSFSCFSVKNTDMGSSIFTDTVSDTTSDSGNEDLFIHSSSGNSSSRPSLSISSSGNDSRCLLSFRVQTAGICTLAASEDKLYTGSEDGLIYAFRLADLKETDRFGTNSNGSVKSIVVRGTDIFSAHQDTKVRAWKAPSHRLSATLPGVRDYVASAVLQRNRQVRRHKRCHWNQHFDTVSCLAVDDRVDILYSGSWDRTLKAWRLRDFRCIQSVDAHTDAINAVAVSNGFVFSCSADSTVKIWRREFNNLGCLASLNAGSPVNCIGLSGNWVYVGCGDGRVRVWMVFSVEDELELDSEGEYKVLTEEFPALTGHSMSVLCVSAAEDVVCTGSADRTIRVWRREDGAHSCICVLNEFHSRCPVKSVMVSLDVMDGCIVYSGGLDGFLKVWWVSLGGNGKARIMESPCSVLESFRV